jgi:hypothetical protein
LGRDGGEDFRVAFFEKCPEPSPEDGGKGMDGNEEAGIGFTPGAIGENRVKSPYSANEMTR